MNPKYVVVAAAITAMLVVVTALATSDSVFAYDKSQATAQANDCGNGELPLNIGCQNTGSQIQGDENVVAMASEQRFGQNGNGPPPDGEACRACLEALSEEQLEATAEQLGISQTIIDQGPEAIIDEICRLLELGPSEGGISVGRLNGAMASSGTTDPDLRKEVRTCLRDAGF